MPATKKSSAGSRAAQTTPTPQSQLDTFLDRYSPEIAARARAILSQMRTIVPGATELVYDNYNALVIGFGPNERASDAVFSIALYPRWINLYFLQGAALADPDGILQGEGNIVRRVLLDDESRLQNPSVRELMKQAIESMEVKVDAGATGRIVIRSISPKQRSRQPMAPTSRSTGGARKGLSKRVP